jgi:ankyrin repeat protein
MNSAGEGGGAASSTFDEFEKVKEMFKTQFGGVEDEYLNTSVNAYIKSKNFYDFKRICVELYKNNIPMVNPGIAGDMFFNKDGNKVNIQTYLDHYYETEKKLKVYFELSSAIQNGDIEKIQLALINGAKPKHIEIKGIKFNPLHLAVSQENADVVHFLLKSGADPNELFGTETELMHAAQKGNAKIVKILLCAGADTKMKNKNGETASDIALEWGEYKIKKIIDKFQIKNMTHFVTHILHECDNFYDGEFIDDLNEYNAPLPPPNDNLDAPPPPPNNNLGGRSRKSRKTHKNKKNKRKTRRHKKN